MTSDQGDGFSDSQDHDRCRCHRPPFPSTDYEEHPVGEDRTEGRFADVTLLTCRGCGQLWLHYAYSIEGITASGRWYRAAISRDEALAIRPEQALAVIQGQPQHYVGGSYYKTSGRLRTKPPKSG